MVRGYQKRIIFLRNTDSRLFDEAYFILSENSERRATKADMISEANRILGENLRENETEVRKKTCHGRRASLLAFAAFIAGALVGGCAMLLLSAL